MKKYDAKHFTFQVYSHLLLVRLEIPFLCVCYWKYKFVSYVKEKHKVDVY